MPSTPKSLAWVILLFAAAPHANCRAQDLPPDAMSLVKTFEKEMQAAKDRYAEEFGEWRQRMTEQLKAVQRKLAEADRLEEAILVRDLAKVYATGEKPSTDVARKFPQAAANARPNSNLAEPLSPEQFAALPKEAKAVLLANEYPGSEKEFVEAALREKSADLQQKLVELKSKYTREEKLDEALAIRNWMAVNLATSLPSVPRRVAELEKPVIPDITAGAKDLSAIQANYGAALQTATTYWERALSKALETLIGKLQPLQKVYSQAGRLEDALSVRELVQRINATPAANARLAALSSSRSKLPEEARSVVDAFFEEVEPLNKEWERTLENLDAQILKPLKEHAAKAIVDGDAEAARRALTALYVQRKEHFPFSELPHRREPLMISGETQEALDSFSEAAHKLVHTADAADASRRKALLAKLRAAQSRNLKSDEELALDASIRYLESPDHAGIRGTLLFQSNPHLKGDLAELVTGYVRETRAAFRALEEQHRKDFDEVKPRLKSIRTKQVEAEDWKAAFSTLLMQREPPWVFEPIPIVFYRFPHTHGVEATVIGVKDGLFRVRQSPYGDVWAPRELIRVGDEKAPESGDDDAPPPGVAVNRRTQLKSGQLLLTKKGGWAWDIVEVVEAGLDTVKVRYTDRANWEEVLERANLRMIPDE